ncbi:MAG: lmo0937 family membrane protein [Candidatus Sulfotelmatobacter sp.]|jgi:hypothetical protein
MLWTIFVVLLILWLLGFSLHFGGALIHLLLVVPLVALVIKADAVARFEERQNDCRHQEVWCSLLAPSSAHKQQRQTGD